MSPTPVTRHKAVDQVLHARAAVEDQRQTEGASRIHDHLRAFVGWKPNARGPTIVAI